MSWNNTGGTSLLIVILHLPLRLTNRVPAALTSSDLSPSKYKANSNISNPGDDGWGASNGADSGWGGGGDANGAAGAKENGWSGPSGDARNYVNGNDSFAGRAGGDGSGCRK